MAVYAQLADGRLLEFPDGTSQEVMTKAVKRFLMTEKGPETGLGSKLVGGFKRTVSDIQTGIESLYDPEGAARRGLERQEELGLQYAPGTDLEAVKKAYAERGLFPAAGEVVSQIPGAVAEQVPTIASTLASARAGAMAGRRFGPLGTLIGGAAGAATPTMAQLFGANLQRQAEEGQEISRGRAAAAAVPGAALEVASTFIPLGGKVISKILGPGAEELLARGGSKIVEEGLVKTLAKGTAVGVMAEIPTEVTQQMLERLQAGLPLTSQDALAEYGQAAYGAGLVGGPFGAVGRVGQRSVARGEQADELREKQRLESEIAAKEAAAAEEAETARKKSPEYRIELIGKINEAEDRLKQVEPIAKDKSADPDVRNEAIAEAKQLKEQLKKLNEEMKASMKEAGLAPTLKEAIAQKPREMPVVDEFGNVVKPKGAPLTEEEYGQKLDDAATKWNETREKIFELRAKEEARQAAERDKYSEQVTKSIKNYLTGLDELDEANLEQRTKLELEKREKGEKEALQQRALDRTQRIVNDFGFHILGYSIDPEVLRLKNEIENLSRPESIAAAPDRDARLKQIDDLKAELDKAQQNASPTSREGLRRLIDEGRVSRDVTNALGIKGLGGRTVSATDALPKIEARINQLEAQRKALTASEKQLIDGNNELTPAGQKLVAVDVQLNELKRLRTVGQQAEETGVEKGVGASVREAFLGKAPALADDIDLTVPITPYIAEQYRKEAEKANVQATGAYSDMAMLLDDYQKGRFFGEKGAQRDIEAASYTREGLLRETEEARKRVIDNLIREISYQRLAEKRPAFTRDEAIKVAFDVNNILEELVNRGTALPSGQFLEIVGQRPAQMRGDKIVKAAEPIARDSRNLKDRQFGAPAQAVEVLAESINQIKQQAIAASVRAVRADKETLQLRKTPREAQPDLVKDLDRVLRMEDLQPEVRDVLEQAQRRMEEGGISVELEELLDEQVGRILRGTDKPFTVEAFRTADVTKPAGRRAMAARADVNAPLIDDIQNRMRIDSELAQYAQGEQRTLVPRGEGFAEVDVQGSLFPETEATARATPAQFQRLQKSGKVRKEQKKVAEAKQKTEETEREIRAAARAVKEELRPEAIQSRKRDLLGRIQQLMQETKQKIESAKFETPDKLMEKVKEEPARALLSRIEIAAKDLKAEDAEFEMSTEGLRLTWVPDSTLNAWARLDESIAKEAKNIKELERLAANAEKGSLEQRKAQALAKQQRVAVQQVLTARKKLAEQYADRQRALETRIQSGLGLPGRRVTVEQRPTKRKKTKEEYAAEMKAYKALPAKERELTQKPTKFEAGSARQAKVVPIKSKEQLDKEIAARRQEQLDDIRRRAKVGSVETVVQKTKEKELDARRAFNDAKAKRDLFELAVKKGEAKKDPAKLKRLNQQVETAKNKLDDIRSDLRLMTSGDIENIVRQPSRGPIGGPVQWYDKKFTPDQMRSMSGLGIDTFSPRSFSVDDSIDFAVGEGQGGGIDQAAADKRMAEVEKKLPAGIKFKYFPTMESVTVDILREMSKQGVDIYNTYIRGGVKPDGTVFVIGGNHVDMVDLEKTIAHEFVGHFTFEGMLGPDGMKNLLGRVDKSLGGVFKLADTLGVAEDARNAYAAGLKYGLSPKDAEVKALKEVIAYTMEKRVDSKFLEKAKRWIQEMVGAFRALLKKMGLLDAASLSTSDLFYMMKQANKYFEEGKPIAYKSADGDISFRAIEPKYGAGMEDLGALADKVVGSQKGFVDKIKANTMGLAGRVQFVDRWAALEEAVKRGVDKGIIDSLKAGDVMYFARIADQRHALTSEVATNGNLKLKEVKRPDGRIEKIVESERSASLKDVAEALQKANVGDADATNRLFTLYLAAERAQNVGLDKLNFSGKITEADMKKALAMGRANPAFQEARKLYNEYNKGLIEFAVKAGAMSKELGAKLLAKGDYIPYYRIRGGVAELLIGGEKPIQIGDTKSQPYLKELIGGDEAIMDFFTSSLQNTSLLTDMALRNMATYQAANVLKDLGVAKVVKGTGPAGKDVIRFKYNGDEYYAQIDTQAKEDLFGDIPSELIVTGMEGIKVIVPGVVRGLAGPANILRKFITRDPRYAVRQVFRDSLTASMTTGSNMIPLVSTMGQLSTLYKEGAGALQRRGITTGQVITGAPEDMNKILQQITSGKPGWDMAMAKLDQFAMAGDAATRMALYNSFLKQGLSEREATMATLESMNFGRRGVSPSIYFLNATVPFFNAGIQGLDVLYRAFTNQMQYAEQLKVKQKLLARGALMAAFTWAYVAMMQDDEAYKNATPEQRYGNWFIRIPGMEEPFRVPIPFELGLIFKAIPEGLMNAAISDEKGSKIAGDLFKQMMRSMPGNPAEAGVPVPTFMKPLIETALNKSFFTNRDIVDARLEGLDKRFQYRDKTPELLKILGPLFEVINLSPVQVENLVRGYTGSLGVGLLSVVDPILRTKEAGAAAPKGMSEVPFVGPIIGGLFQPNDAGRVINEAYDSVKEIQSRQNTYRKLREEGQTKEAEEYLKENLPALQASSAAGAFRQQMGEITKAERAVKAAPPDMMTPEQKRKRLDELRELKNNLARRMNELSARTERQAAR